MESALPRAGGPALATAFAIGLLAACSGSATQRCEDGSYCPEGTRCGSGAFCLVEEAACGDFGANAPCVSPGDAGARFCVSGGCQDGVRISGRLAFAGGGGAIEGATVAALDREWMEQDDTDEIGGFAIDAVQNDTDLVLRAEGNEMRPPLLTRRLALGTGNYSINGEATTALRVPTRAELGDWAMLVGIKTDPSQGAVVVQIGRAPGSGIEGATADIVGPMTVDPPLYFKDGPNDGPAPNATSTSSGTPVALFLGVEPGVYTVTGGHQNALECVAAGDDRPDPIVIDVRAGELTDAGWILCRQR